jgi:hypothetical protein
MYIFYKGKYRKISFRLTKGIKTYTIRYDTKTIKVSREKYRFYNIKPKNPPKMSKSKKRLPKKSGKSKRTPKCSKGKVINPKTGRCINANSKILKKLSPKYKQERKVIPPLAKGTLRRHGYSAKLSTQKRRIALTKAVKAYGKNTVIRKLNAVKTLQKNKNPQVSSIFDSDMKWVQGKY